MRYVIIVFVFIFSFMLASSLTLLTAHAEVVAPGTNIQIEVRKGQVIHLPRAASSVMIADPVIADVDVKSPKAVYVFGRQIGETTLYVLDENDKNIYSAVVQVTHNISGLNKLSHDLFPKSQLKFNSSDGALVIKGYAASQQEAANITELASSYLAENEHIINMLTIGGSDQVSISLRIAEVARSELNQFGINLDTIFNAGNFAFGLATGRDFLDEASNTILRSGEQGGLYLGHNSTRWNINGIIDALEDEGFMTTLAEPNLTAMSGQTASFLAGGEFPIPIVDDDGQVTVEFREYGVGLVFTPTVLSDNRISLKVAPEVSALTSVGAVTLNGFVIPALSTRRTETTIEMGSGQTFAIAGLLQNDISNNISQFPGLGNIPVLGSLFRSSRFQKNETELVILITPYIVKPTSGHELKTPLDGYTFPTDVERILFGKLYKEYNPSETPETPGILAENGDMPSLNGPAGFAFE